MSRHDDQVDAVAGAFHALTKRRPSRWSLKFYWFRVYGLGVSFDSCVVFENDAKRTWVQSTTRLYLVCLMINLSAPLTREKRP
jgi:hypothetical protein